MNDDGFWNGVVSSFGLAQDVIQNLIYQVGMVHRNELDIGVTSLFATSQRKNVVDFSRTLQYAEYNKHTKYP